jgi:hypothetical protein
VQAQTSAAQIAATVPGASRAVIELVTGEQASPDSKRSLSRVAIFMRNTSGVSSTNTVSHRRDPDALFRRQM